MRQHHVTSGALDEGSDGGLVQHPGDEVTPLMPRYWAVLDLGWAVGDHDHRVNEYAPVGSAARTSFLKPPRTWR
jgi:hypothetical protein